MCEMELWKVVVGIIESLMRLHLGRSLMETKIERNLQMHVQHWEMGGVMGHFKKGRKINM